MCALKTLGMRRRTPVFFFLYLNNSYDAKCRIFLNAILYSLYLLSRFFSLEKGTRDPFAKWISSNVWYNMHVANNDATQYCETSERGAAEIRSQKRDRMRVQEVRAGGKVVAA